MIINMIGIYDLIESKFLVDNIQKVYKPLKKNNNNNNNIYICSTLKKKKID